LIIGKNGYWTFLKNQRMNKASNISADNSGLTGK